MPPTQTGATQNFNPNMQGSTTGTVSSTITVPADATKVVCAVTNFQAANPAFGTWTFTKGGVDTAMTKIAGTADSLDGYQGTMYYLDNPDTGSNKTLKWVNNASGGESQSIVSLMFFKDVDTGIRDSDGDNAGAMAGLTFGLDVVTGDLVLVWVFGFTTTSGVDATASMTGVALRENIPVQLFNDAIWYDASPSTGTLTVTIDSETGFDDGGLAGLVLKAAAAAGDDDVGYQRLVGPLQLDATAATLYTVPTGCRVELRSVYVNNPSGSEREVTFSIGTDAAGTRWKDQWTVPAGESVQGRRMTNHVLTAGETIQGFCDSASTVVAQIDGYLEVL